VSKSKTTSHAKDSANDPTAEAASGLLIFPGISLMRCTRIRGGVRVRCPGCRATKDILVVPGATVDGLFKHRRKTCPIARRIAEALERLEQLSNCLLN